jgi:hypothetical protein
MLVIKVHSFFVMEFGYLQRLILEVGKTGSGDKLP